MRKEAFVPTLCKFACEPNLNGTAESSRNTFRKQQTFNTGWRPCVCSVFVSSLRCRTGSLPNLQCDVRGVTERVWA